MIDLYECPKCGSVLDLGGVRPGEVFECDCCHNIYRIDYEIVLVRDQEVTPFNGS